MDTDTKTPYQHGFEAGRCYAAGFGVVNAEMASERGAEYLDGFEEGYRYAFRN